MPLKPTQAMQMQVEYISDKQMSSDEFLNRGVWLDADGLQTRGRAGFYAGGEEKSGVGDARHQSLISKP